jgi:hypothetical protein
LLAATSDDTQRANLAIHLQQTYGNNYVQRLIESRVVQAKLTVNPLNDIYEQEANRVAGEVSKAAASQMQRQAEEEEEEVQTQPDESQLTAVNDNVETRINTARLSGQPMMKSVRASLEPQFGIDFSGVRIHSDTEADMLSRELGANAFTTGRDIFFRENAYQPHSESGKWLLAHELSHVVQQDTGRVSGDGRDMTIHPAGELIKPRQEAVSIIQRKVSIDEPKIGATKDPPCKDADGWVTHTDSGRTKVIIERWVKAANVEPKVEPKVGPKVGPKGKEYKVTEGDINSYPVSRYGAYKDVGPKKEENLLDEAKWQVDGPRWYGAITEQGNQAKIHDAPGWASAPFQRPVALYADFQYLVTEVTDWRDSELDQFVKQNGKNFAVTRWPATQKLPQLFEEGPLGQKHRAVDHKIQPPWHLEVHG